MKSFLYYPILHSRFLSSWASLHKGTRQFVALLEALEQSWVGFVLGSVSFSTRMLFDCIFLFGESGRVVKGQLANQIVGPKR